MRSLRSVPVSLLLTLLVNNTHADHTPWHDCSDSSDATCKHLLEPITILRPGLHYIAKLPCLDCPVPIPGKKPDWIHQVTNQSNDLFFNITLSPDRTSLRLNSRDTYPFLSTHPDEPLQWLWTSQIYPNITRSFLELSSSVGCDQGQCTRVPCVGCLDPPDWMSSVRLDYEYSEEQIKADMGSGTAGWEITFNPLGGYDGYEEDPIARFNHSDQRMLTILVNGKLIEEDEVESNPQAGSTLFGSFGKKHEPVYELEIAEVKLVQRRRSVREPLNPVTFLDKVGHFFGMDDPQPRNHRVVFYQEEWGFYGKKGTLRNAWGILIYDWPWDLVIIIVVSTIGGLIGLYAVYRLFFWVLEQRRLARWGGIDEVWRTIRNEEEHGLLHEGYRDEPSDDIPPPPYTDELQVNKPLPSIPSPDATSKPLPAVPLIDDV